MDLPAAAPCSSERVELLNMHSGNTGNRGVSHPSTAKLVQVPVCGDEGLCCVEFRGFCCCVILSQPLHLVQWQGLFMLSKLRQSKCEYLLALMFTNILQREQTSFASNTTSSLMRGKAHVLQASPLLPSAANVLGFCLHTRSHTRAVEAVLQYAFKWDY